jgi:hypothetical protein
MPADESHEPDDPTRIASARRPIERMQPAPAQGGVTFHQIAAHGGVLCVECRACGRRSALTKQECPAIRHGNARYVLHVTFRCERCGSDQPRLYQATDDEATMFLAGDRLRRQIGR